LDVDRKAQCGKANTTRTRGLQQPIIRDAQLKWSDIWSLVRPHLHLLIAAILVGGCIRDSRNCLLVINSQGAVVVALLNIQIPILLGDMVNVIADMLKLSGSTVSTQQALFPGSISKLNSIAMQLVALYSGQALFTLLMITCLSRMGERMASGLRVRLFDHLLHFDMAFFDQQRVGELNDRLNVDVQEFKSSFKTCVSQGLRTFTQVWESFTENY